MEHFYDGQIKRYLTQFMRVLSNFSYKDAKGKLVQIPVRYGDMNRQVAQIMKKNSENVVQSAPFIACYIKGMEFARDRLQDPTYVSKMNIRERAFDENGNEYLNVQGANYTVERLMPTPFNLQFTADIWTTNTDQKLQLLEQLLVLFNPSLEIQTSNNYIDWTSLSVLELTGMTFSSRSIPQGLEQDIDIASLNFSTPIWLTTPAKVKKLGVITKIITSIYEDPIGTKASGAYSDPTEVDYFSGRNPVSIGYTTLGNLGLLILDNTAKLIPEGSNGNGFKNWMSILDAYPGKFTASLSQIRLIKPDGNEIVGYISLDPADDSVMHVNFDQDTVPMDTLITDATNLNPRGTVDAVINPETFNPRPYLPNGDLGWPVTDARYLILEDILSDSASGPEAWKNEDNSSFSARANDIIQWDGDKWNIIFNSANNSTLTYITNARTGVQYAWDGSSWMKSYEGAYNAGQWRLVL
jgi:hypothetical protein